MINLLPADQKQALLYARRNTMLLRWLTALLIIIAITGGIVFLGRTYLQSETDRYVTITAQTRQELKDQNLEATQANIQGISSNLKLIVQVLSRQIIFSELIQQIGVVMPANAVLSDVEISKVDGGIDLTAEAKDYQTATQIQVNITDPANKLFDKADIVTIKCESQNNDEYPCTVTLRALFTKSNPYLFINKSADKKVTP